MGDGDAASVLNVSSPDPDCSKKVLESVVDCCTIVPSVRLGLETVDGLDCCEVCGEVLKGAGEEAAAVVATESVTPTVGNAEADTPSVGMLLVCEGIESVTGVVSDGFSVSETEVIVGEGLSDVF